ncbi:MAG: monofunctional biosynthetic peptidoglycan transglycosylase [Candidatus Aminicenantes bacterium]|nr:monofunctional biosynthetic peptidoglycan transglycosylase [Candidatus Aminicenantes bacterium]
MAEEMKKKRKKMKLFLIVLLCVLAALGLFTAYFFLSLPNVAYLKDQNPQTTSVIEQRKQETQQKGKSLKIRQKWVGFNTIPELLRNTIRVSEDVDFYSHDGIDFYELKESIKRNLKEGKKARGGSTITQQLAKNLFLSTEKSYYRKLKEMVIAKRMEKYLSKDRIFSIYLNVIELGNGIFGVEAASEIFFNKSVNRLTLSEIIRLAAVIPKPLKVTPLSNSNYLKWRANLLLERLVKYGYISESEYRSAKEEFKK